MQNMSCYNEGVKEGSKEVRAEYELLQWWKEGRKEETKEGRKEGSK